MQFRRRDLEAIFDGRCGLAFRRWRRPTVKAGGTLRTAMGLIRIDAIEIIDPDTVTEADARAAGYTDRRAVLAMFASQEGTCYRVRLHAEGPDPREALQDDIPDEAEMREIRQRLARVDARAGTPWTARTLKLIDDHPGVVSTALAETIGLERSAFKDNVRKLKAMGLTVSLEVGYRLSARGHDVLKRL